MKAFLIIGFVVAVLVGGLLALRSSARSGMPSEDVLRRASQRARELDAQEKKDD
jgi:Protein of unknown function (DUF2897)